MLDLIFFFLRMPLWANLLVLAAIPGGLLISAHFVPAEYAGVLEIATRYVCIVLATLILFAELVKAIRLRRSLGIGGQQILMLVPWWISLPILAALAGGLLYATRELPPEYVGVAKATIGIIGLALAYAILLAEARKAQMRRLLREAMQSQTGYAPQSWPAPPQAGVGSLDETRVRQIVKDMMAQDETGKEPKETPPEFEIDVVQRRR